MFRRDKKCFKYLVHFNVFHFDKQHFPSTCVKNSVSETKVMIEMGRQRSTVPLKTKKWLMSEVLLNLQLKSLSSNNTHSNSDNFHLKLRHHKLSYSHKNYIKMARRVSPTTSCQ